MLLYAASLFGSRAHIPKTAINPRSESFTRHRSIMTTWWREAVTGCRRFMASPASKTKYNSRSFQYTTKSTPYPSSSSSPSRSPVDSNIARILRNEIQYLFDYAPPRQLATEFERFMVENRPGEQWITLRGKSTEDENIKIEATMFDGSTIDPKSGDEGTKEVRLHISLLVDIWKGDGTEIMEFVCSSWPDSLEIQKVYVFRRDKTLFQPYMGPDIKNLNPKFRTEFYKFLKTRGIDDGLSEFLHDYMMNKDRIEFIQWLHEVQYYFEI